MVLNLHIMENIDTNDNNDNASINEIYENNIVEFYNIDMIDEKLDMMNYPKNPLERAQQLMIDMDIMPDTNIQLDRRDYTKEVLYELFGKKIKYMHMTSDQFTNIIDYTIGKISPAHDKNENENEYDET